MSSNAFFTSIQSATQGDDSWVFRTLREFCEGIRQYIGEPVDCEMIPGSNDSEYGMEIKVVLSFHPIGLFQTLVRGYVPGDAKSLYLDLMDKQGPVGVKSEDDLRAKLTSYLKVPTVLETLDSLRRRSEVIRGSQ